MNFKNHHVFFYTNSLRLFVLTALLFVMSSCSLSGSIKSTASQKDEVPATPITSPVTGSDELRLTEPTEYVKPSNESAYPLTGSCKTVGTLTVEVNDTIVKTGVTCTSETFATTIDLSSITSGDVSIKIYTDSNSEIVSTVTIVKDTVAPSLIGTVIDGTYFNSTSTTPTLTWTAAADAHSGVAIYEIAIGTTAGGTDILNWTSTNSTTASHSQSGLTLIEGTQYFASLRAVDNAGNTSTSIQSDGWTVDATAPTLATSFTDGGEINFSSTSSKVLNWVASTDAASGLSGYEVALGTTAGATDVMNWTSVGNVITDTIDSLTLFGNRRYYASLRSVDVAGNRTASVMSDGWWNLRQTKKAVDATTPQARWVSASANFGTSVALSEDGNTLVVGVPKDDTNETGHGLWLDTGAAFVYIKSSGIWVYQQKLVATGVNSRFNHNYFGHSVAISNDTIVVGAYGQWYDENGENNIDGAGGAYVFTRNSGVWSLQQRLSPSGINSRGTDDRFGYSLAIDENTIVIGAYGQDYDANGGMMVTDAGAAYVFVRSAGVWSQQQKLVATGTNSRLAYDVFGTSVSIDSDTIVVGAYGQNFDDVGAGTDFDEAGAAYIFIRSAGVWSQQQKLVASGTNARRFYDYFGNSVSISGETVVIGAYEQDYDVSGGSSVSNAGAAYVFTRSAGTWLQQQKLVATGVNARTASDKFGTSVSISAETIVIGFGAHDYNESGGALAANAGAAYVFSRSGGVWSTQQKLAATGTNARVAGDRFGDSVFIRGETIVSGSSLQSYDSLGESYIAFAGAAYVFSRAASLWTQDQKIVDEAEAAPRADLVDARFGYSISISEDSSTLVVGAPNDDTDENNQNFIIDAGAAFVFLKSGSSWIFQQKIVASGTNARMAEDGFGLSVAISGETIVVGAYNHDYDAIGSSMLSNAGAAYVFTRTSGTWSQQQKLVGIGVNSRFAGDLFGGRVAISNETIVVGADEHDYDSAGSNILSNAGAAFVFVRNAGVWSLQQKLVATGTNSRLASDTFGTVAIHNDTIVVGSRHNDYDESGSNLLNGAGSVFVYVRNAGVWTQQQKIIATGVNARGAFDFFGASVSLHEDTILVGSIWHKFDVNGENSLSNAGAAFVFVRNSGVWSQQQKLVATGTNARNANDYFGSWISINGNTLVVGVANHDFDVNGENSLSGAGTAFVFRRATGVWSQELKLIPSGVNSRLLNSQFGTFVAITENESADGYTIGVGASGDVNDSSGGGNAVNGAGSVYIFD